MILVEICYSICAYNEINCDIINFIGCTSFNNLLILFVASYVFRFCYLYRLALILISLVNVIALYDTYIGIPFDNL
jgi:hypothetical protein